MNLGERIYQLRKKKNLSQEDLAELLEVSRQSVSKWETNASVPDLDKLVKLSDVFGVSLDELIRGEAGQPAAEGPSAEDPPGEAVPPDFSSGVRYGDRTADRDKGISSTQRIIGFILLGVGLLLLILLTLVGGWTGLIVGAPLLACSIICLKCRHAGLWCSWLLVLLTAVVLRMGTGVRTSIAYFGETGLTLMPLTRLGVFSWLFFIIRILLLVWTVYVFSRTEYVWNRKTGLRTIVSGAVYLASELIPLVVAAAFNNYLTGFGNKVSYDQIAVPMMWYEVALCVCELASYISAAAFCVMLIGLIRSALHRKKEKSAT